MPSPGSRLLRRRDDAITGPLVDHSHSRCAGLPDGSGFDLAREIQVANGDAGDFHDGDGSAENRLEGMRSAPGSSFRKPVSIARAAAANQTCARQSHAVRPQISCTAAGSISTRASSCSRRAARVSAPTKDIQLLQLLVVAAPLSSVATRSWTESCGARDGAESPHGRQHDRHGCGNRWATPRPIHPLPCAASASINGNRESEMTQEDDGTYAEITGKRKNVLLFRSYPLFPFCSVILLRLAKQQLVVEGKA